MNVLWVSQADFDNGNQAVWNSARLTTWNYSPSTTDITFTAIGDSTVNGHSTTDSWGTNRYGYDFTTANAYNIPIISDTHWVLEADMANWCTM